MTYHKNQSVIVTIDDIGMNGEGIGRADGYTLFVKDAIVGDTVEAGLTKVKKTYAYARLMNILSPSPDRITPPCRIHRQCGGCQIQAMSYESQLAFKEKKVKNDLARIAGLSADDVDAVMEGIVGMKEGETADGEGPGFRYRNKAQYPVGTDREGRVIAGFYAGRTHAIISADDCLLGPAENRKIIDLVLAHMERFHILPYDETTGEGNVRHVMIRKGFASGQIMVCIVARQNELAAADTLINELQKIPGMASVSLNVQPKNTNVILGPETVLLWGKETIEDEIRICDAKNCFAPTGEALQYAISPLSFYQVNPVQTERMYSQALEYAGRTGGETVWDLYCGIGTISLFMAKRAKQVIGVEVIAQAVNDARENARRNGIENVEFITGKAEEILPSYYEKTENSFCHPDVIIVDPPRKGCDILCLKTMVNMQPDRIVYVSCDPATLARDIKYLSENGYALTKARAFDNFPQTIHVETVCLLRRTTKRSDMERGCIGVFGK